MTEWLLEKRIRVILAGILVVTVPLVSLATFVYYFIDPYSLTRSLEQMKMDENLGLADRIVYHIEEKLKSDIALVRAYASRPILVEGFRSDNRGEMVRQIRSLVENSHNIERVFVTSPKGVLLADYPSDPSVMEKDFSRRDWYRGVSMNWQPYVSEYYIRDAQPQRYVFAVAVPVIAKDNRPVGIIVMQPKDSYIRDVIGKTHVENTVVYMVDKNGDLVYHSRYPVEIAPSFR